MPPRIVTTGVYGFTEEEFFGALRATGIDTFCDIRARRGLRGSTYAFANSAYLQKRLAEIGIRYLHLKELAPSEETRAAQTSFDKSEKVAKRKRTGLSDAFRRAYADELLNNFDSAQFLEQLGPDASMVCLFCVEGEPEACHRSLLASKLSSDLGLEVEHIRPPQQ